MQNPIQLVGVVLMLALSASTSLAEEITPINAAQDGYAVQTTGKTILDSKIMVFGKNRAACYRFENIPIPNGAFLESAGIQVPCKNCRSPNLRLRICGDYAGNAPDFESANFSLTNRTWTRNCQFPVTGPDSNQTYDVTPVLQEIVRHSWWQSGNAAVLCFTDEGSRGAHTLFSIESGNPAVLTAAFEISGKPIGINAAPPLGICEFETNGDGFADLFFDDIDGDGYCEFPIGSKKFFGTLILDRDMEIIGPNPGTPGATSGITFRGNKIRIVEGGEVISDFQSITPSSDPALGNLTLELIANSGLSVTANAIISDLGSPENDYGKAGVVLLRTELPNADILIDSPLILSRNLTVESNGGINIINDTMIGSLGNINVRTLQTGQRFDITVADRSLIFVSDGDLIFQTGSTEDFVNIKHDAVFEASEINFCGVKGGLSKIFIGPRVKFVGVVRFPGDPGCTP